MPRGSIGFVSHKRAYNHDMRSDSSNICGEASPETNDALVSGGFYGAIQKTLVWHSPIRESCHLLHLGLDVVKRQTHGGSDGSTDDTGEDPCHVRSLLAEYDL